jgi:DNA helicase-2/ATP-dependent DNA helicase PcrA
MAKLLQMPDPAGADETIHLNPEQRAAVFHGEGPLLVVAGAGTGKTRVITERIRHLLLAQPDLPGEAILGLTFTEKAAAEMKHRVVRTAGERGERVWLGTYHAFCHHLLVQLNPALRVLDEVDYWILLRRNLPRLQLKHYFKLADPGRFLSDFTQFFSRCQDELVTPEAYQQYVDSLVQCFVREQAHLDDEERAARQAELARLQEVAHAFLESERMLRERNLVTFGGLLLRTVLELRANPDLLDRLQQRYRYILVDEFQDSNIAQIELLWLLGGDRRNIVAVGDDDQAIYRFRGASFGSFKLFLEKFAAGNPRPTAKHIALRQNYRSTQRILRVASAVISHNRDRYLPDKELFTRNPLGVPVRIVEFEDAEKEAVWVASELERLHAARCPWSAMAVLYRMHTHREHLVGELRRRGLPFVIRNLSILENPLVRDVIAYLRLVDNPADDVACARVLAAPAWGLQPADLVRFAQRTDRSRGHSLWAVLAEAQRGLPEVRVSARIAELQQWIDTLHARANKVPASDIVEALVDGLQLNLLPTDPGRRYLDRLLCFITEWERKSETKKLAELIEYLGYVEEAQGIIALEEESPGDAVQLMTVHAAKGLEFPYVFLVRLSAGAFPARPRQPVLEFPVALMKEALPEGDVHIQEERRLFYVALTRAQRELTLTTVVNRRTKPSLFLEDILMNAELVHRNYVTRLTPAVTPAPSRPTRLFPRRGPESRVDSRIGEWAQQFHPPAPEPLRLSASAIDTYDRCPMKYLFGQVWGLSGGPQAAVTFGNLMHTTIKEFVALVHQGYRPDVTDVEAIYERNWSDAGFRDAYQRDAYKKAGLEQLRAFCQSYQAAPPQVVAQERRFELALDRNVVVTGRIDQINRAGDNKQVEIVDYKTGQPQDQKTADRSLQLSLYALGARDVLGYEPVRLTFYNLATNEAISTTRSANALAEAEQRVLEVADEIRARHFPARPGFACRTCEFQPICPEHEQPELPAPTSGPRQATE